MARGYNCKQSNVGQRYKSAVYPDECPRSTWRAAYKPLPDKTSSVRSISKFFKVPLISIIRLMLLLNFRKITIKSYYIIYTVFFLSKKIWNLHALLFLLNMLENYHVFLCFDFLHHRYSNYVELLLTYQSLF